MYADVMTDCVASNDVVKQIGGVEAMPATLLTTHAVIWLKPSAGWL